MAGIYSVSQVNSYVGTLFREDFMLRRIRVRGELSNVKYHSSGHIYFSLKDENSTVRCFLPYSRTETLRFELEDGMEIINNTANIEAVFITKKGSVILSQGIKDSEGIISSLSQRQ